MKPIIIDIGSCNIKAGPNDDDKPFVKVPSCVGQEYDNLTIGKALTKEKKYYCKECEKQLDNLKLYCPLNHGTFFDKEDMQNIFDYIYKQIDLSEEQIKKTPVLITEPLFSSKKNKHSISEYLFEGLEAPFLFFGAQPVLSLLGTSLTDGVIIESGGRITQTCVVQGGYPVPATYIREEYGGEEVTECLQNMLFQKGISFVNNTGYKTVKIIKENYCYTKCYVNEDEEGESDIFDLPDGSCVMIKEERQKCTDILFDPKIDGLNFRSMQKMIYDSINNVNLESKIKLCKEIVLSGGNTAIKGMPATLHKELKSLMPKNVKVRLYTPSNPEQRCWVGGKVITSLEEFKNLWITKEEWAEKGDKVLKEKFI